jgi:COP9 signalosome complex subunit 2
MNLIQAYQDRDILHFEKILNQNRKNIMEDEFMRHYMEDLVTNLRTHYLKKLISPYTRIKLGFIAEKMKISVPEVESLLITLILDRDISGSIDQINQVLTVSSALSSSYFKYQSVGKWTNQLKSINQSISGNVRDK